MILSWDSWVVYGRVLLILLHWTTKYFSFKPPLLECRNYSLYTTQIKELCIGALYLIFTVNIIPAHSDYELGILRSVVLISCFLFRTVAMAAIEGGIGIMGEGRGVCCWYYRGTIHVFIHCFPSSILFTFILLFSVQPCMLLKCSVHFFCNFFFPFQKTLPHLQIEFFSFIIFFFLQ